MVLVLFKNIHIKPSYGRKMAHAQIWGAHVFWPFLSLMDRNFYGSSGDYNLSTGDEKSYV